MSVESNHNRDILEWVCENILRGKTKADSVPDTLTFSNGRSYTVYNKGTCFVLNEPEFIGKFRPINTFSN